MYEKLATADPADAEMQLNCCLGCWDLGKTHTFLARRAATDEARVPLLECARDEYQKGVDGLRKLQDAGRLPPRVVPYIERWEKDVKDCESALQKLRS